ncbi:hypothetical protein EST38_g4366 [Candolleomyces aberdarensis]|uniref:Nephrocystin 3-like N-terminal domain-containing protein n=1 Tax=Candolleomyces aberdarensis TaxID=2316362 RepID=A0A4Q2DQL3_9AGAR|nr:hypothetical protein EST38_g4366 [Candolleomyces aberdarensis]
MTVPTPFPAGVHNTSRLGSRTGSQVSPSDGWELLLKNGAPDALHDSPARDDAPTCDRDTRVEVKGEIMDWIEDRDSSQRLLCITGAAGAGKSALQQTIAEICRAKNTLGGSFFFSSEDPSRNNVGRVVSTIAYGLGRKHPALKTLIKTAVEDDPRIFSQPLQAQMNHLIVTPFSGLTTKMGVEPIVHPQYVILIDGLDECEQEDGQVELLKAIKQCLLRDGLPFRILISSRPERAIRTALELDGYLHDMAYHLQLSEKHDATEDIRRYLQRRFERIGRRISNPQWFTKEDIETIVEAASGLFIFAAAVYKYIRVTSSAKRLKVVLNWTSQKDQDSRPFQALDNLYTNILSAAEAAYPDRDFHLRLRAYQVHSPSVTLPGFITSESVTEALGMILDLEPKAVGILVSDLSSLVALEKDDQGGQCLRLHHKSFSDFLDDLHRANDLFVPFDRVYAYIANHCMRTIIQFSPDLESFPNKWARIQLPELKVKTLEAAVAFLPNSLRRAHVPDIEHNLVDFTKAGGWKRLEKLLHLLYDCGEYRLTYWRALLNEACTRIKVPIDEYPGTSRSPGVNNFSNAQNFKIGNAYFNTVLNHSDSDSWKLLAEQSAPNAFHNSRARYDRPKCDEDTRLEVTTELMNWIEDRTGPQRLLCMTGAAGAGKSALQQTVAERCGKSNILGSAFFFGAADPTRNTVTPVVPTIAFQLGLANPALKEAINLAIDNDPTIFSRSLQEQMDTLIAGPVRGLPDPKALPAYAILIDGLDECKGEHHQSELLGAIKESLLADDLPFRIFIASRPEWAIRSELDPGGDLHELAYHIQLSDKYDATADIRRYLWRRLRDIGRKSRDPRARSPLWPAAEDIEILVRAASGQFIYAATVVKYVSEPRTYPSGRLETVIGWTPAEDQLARPFETLDRLYANILSEAKDAYEAVDIYTRRDFLLLFKAYHMKDTKGLSGLDLRFTHTTALNAVLGLEEWAHDSLISDLHSLVVYEPSQVHGFKLRSYHRSFSEFMESESRSQALFVPASRVYAHIAKCSLQNINRCPLTSIPDSYVNWEELSTTPRTALISVFAFSICLLNADPIDREIIAFSEEQGWNKIDKLLLSLKPVRNRWVQEVMLPRLVDILLVLIGRFKDEGRKLVGVLVDHRDKWRFNL